MPYRRTRFAMKFVKFSLNYNLWLRGWTKGVRLSAGNRTSLPSQLCPRNTSLTSTERGGERSDSRSDSLAQYLFQRSTHESEKRSRHDTEEGNPVVMLEIKPVSQP
jgi:hypothetical protein